MVVWWYGTVREKSEILRVSYWAMPNYYMGGRRCGCPSGTCCPSLLVDPPLNDEGMWAGVEYLGQCTAYLGVILSRLWEVTRDNECFRAVKEGEFHRACGGPREVLG